jgi:hypothetical protein
MLGQCFKGRDVESGRQWAGHSAFGGLVGQGAGLYLCRGVDPQYHGIGDRMGALHGIPKHQHQCGEYGPSIQKPHFLSPFLELILAPQHRHTWRIAFSTIFGQT